MDEKKIQIRQAAPETPVSETMPEMPFDIYDLNIDRDQMNAFPFWFERIKNIKSDVLKIPRSVCLAIPVELRKAFYMEHEHDMEAIMDFVDNKLMPAIKQNNLGLVFLKNGCYSHKFDARSGCLPIMSDLAHAVMTIMQEAMMRCGFQYDGTECIIARERIMSNPFKTPCIYNGLPFRPEYRVFYDFDKHQPIFTADYWDEDYVRPNLRDLTDQLIYDAWYPGHIRPEYEKNQAMVTQAVTDAMRGVENLTGPWSIDIMQDEEGNFWLIDMAVAEMSAYWERRPKD